MKKNLTIVVLLLCSIAVNGQEFSMDFKQVTAVDFSKKYEKDPQAEAIVIFDKGKSFFVDNDRTLDIRFIRQKRIKILDEKGLKHSEVGILYYQDGYGKTEKVSDIKAYTYNLMNGLIEKKELDPSTIYTEDVNDKYKRKKFVFPDVKEGSIIEYEYTFETPFKYHLPDWEFQDEIPTIYSEYELRLVPFYEYVYIAQGVNQFDYFDSKEIKGLKRTIAGYDYTEMKTVFVLKDVPAFKDESYISSVDDYIIKLDFQLAKFYSPYGGETEIISTWPKLAEELEKHDDFGRYIKGASRIAGKILDSELNINDLNKLERAEVIINYVKNSFNWDGYYGEYASKSPKKFFEQKNGNVGDINLFLIAMLREAGIETYPVILSTRGHGKVLKEYPFSHFFNYVIAMVKYPGVSFLADGTESYLSFNKVPPKCFNGVGLTISESVSFIDLSSPELSNTNRTIKLEIDPDNLTASANIMEITSNFEAYTYKSYYEDNTSDMINELEESGFVEIEDVQTRNYDTSEKPYILAYKGTTEVEALDNMLVIKPFLHFPMSKNRLTQKKRSYPVDFTYSSSKDFNSAIKIPEGYKVVSLPEDFEMDNNLAGISISSKETNGEVLVSGNYTLKKAVYQPSEYSRLKSYLDLIVRKFNEEVVFEKN
jgi:transglutaminase-like putative cysteine protease